jgi:hypothetical protein
VRERERKREREREGRGDWEEGETPSKLKSIIQGEGSYG